MRKSFFTAMKEKMEPEEAVVASLKYRLNSQKRDSVAGIMLRWAPCALSCAVAVLCVFNMSMPAEAEQLPVVGTAFASLNETGREARLDGKTPVFLLENGGEEAENVEVGDLEILAGFCNGLDLTFHIRYEDREGLIDDEVSSLTLSWAEVYIDGIALAPTLENPILRETADGVFSGEARFNASPIAGLLSDGETLEFAFYHETLFGYWDGMEESCGSPYEYEGKYITVSTAYVDLSELEMEYHGIENDGLTLEYTLKSEGRTDVVFSVSESVEYSDCFTVYTGNDAPDMVVMNPGIGSDGQRTYCATFTNSEKPLADGTEVESKTDCELIAAEDVVFYSEATGEYYRLIDEGENK